MKSFCDNYNLKALITQPACYKHLAKPTCIDFNTYKRDNVFKNEPSKICGRQPLKI